MHIVYAWSVYYMQTLYSIHSSNVFFFHWDIKHCENRNFLDVRNILLKSENLILFLFL